MAALEKPMEYKFSMALPVALPDDPQKIIAPKEEDT